MNQLKMGKLIADMRKEKKITQKELAIRLGVNSKSISRWENGNQSPDISLLQLLTSKLEIDELLSGEINMLKKGTEINAKIDYDKHEYQITKIKALPNRFNYEDDNIIIEAYIFGMDIIIYEKGITLLTLKLSDKTDSVIARVGVPNSSLSDTLVNVKLGTSWRFYGECFNKQYDGMSIIKMQQIPQISISLIDKEQEKYFFFEALDVKTVKSRKQETLKDKLKSLEKEV